MATARNPQPGDPIWAPIEGVSLDDCALISAALLESGTTGRGDVERFVTDHGVPPGAWPAVRDGWIERMAHHPAVRMRYGLVYSQARG
jgi:hypothetical protein